MTETIPNPRVKSTALFNRLNGEFVTVTSIPLEESNHNSEYYVAREVEYLFGPGGDAIVGKLNVISEGVYEDAFEVVPFDTLTETVTEAQMNAMAAEKITSRYPLTAQVNLLAKALLAVGKKLELEDTTEFDELNEMLEYIKYCLQVNKVKKEHYANDPDINYESDEQLTARVARSMEGGVHEELGPRTISGGRVFS